jgi:hypothetical protein
MPFFATYGTLAVPCPHAGGVYGMLALFMWTPNVRGVRITIWTWEPQIFPNGTDTGDLQALAINQAPVLERHPLRG